MFLAFYFILMDQNLLKIRHSLAHIMAQAIQRIIDPNVKLGIGPAIDNGFYYDIELTNSYNLSDKDLKKIEKTMKEIIKEDQKFKKVVLEVDKAKDILSYLWQNYKLELLEEIMNKWEEISFYINIVSLPSDKVKNFLQRFNEEYYKLYQWLKEKFGLDLGLSSDEFPVFIDLCEWPHVEKTSDIPVDSFKLYKVAGAYRRGDENNPMLTRVYWYAFNSKQDLQDYLKFLEEAKKRDHRVLGPKLGLFTIQPEEVGPGLVLRKPKWATIFNILADLMAKECEKRWYIPVRTPHIWKKNLWETSWHWWFYNDSMYPPLELWMTLEDWQDNRKPKESEVYLLKPMNCPFHVQIYKDDIHSYKELPIRYWEFWTVYRYEKKGELWGLTRVRWFTQDDAHIICRPSQVKEEFSKTVDFVLDILSKFWFDDIEIFISLSDPSSNKYVWDKKMWKLAESSIEEVLQEKGINYTKEIWEAAFYGPKADFKIKDALGRLWQCSTVQFDFNLPERFDMYYINEKWEKERPFMIHRAIYWSFERFIWILIEHFGGAFPFWLAPEQIRIIPLLKVQKVEEKEDGENILSYAMEIYEQLKNSWFRVKVDLSEASLAKKIRNAEIEKIPYVIVIWEKEFQNKKIAVRDRDTKQQFEIDLLWFIDKIQKYLKSW